MSDSRSARSAFGLRELLEQRVADRTSELAEKNNQLNQVLSEIKVLSGLIPICMYCKEIRDDKGAWNRLE